MRARGYNCQVSYKRITISQPGVDYDPVGDTCGDEGVILKTALHGWTMILRGYESRRELTRCKL